MKTDDLADDILPSMAAVVQFIWAPKDNAEMKKRLRQAYHLAAGTKSNRLPLFKIGAIYCGRKSRIRQWVEDQERRHLEGERGR